MHFERVVLFTAVGAVRVRPILDILVADAAVPAWFREIEIVSWSGRIKDLRFVGDVAVDDVLLVDDMAAYVHPEQRVQWVPVAPFESPYPQSDDGLAHLTAELRTRLRLGHPAQNR